MSNIAWVDTDTEVYTCLAQRSNCFWRGSFIPPCQTISIGNRTLLWLSTIFRINKIGTREVTLHSCSEWNNFIETCYSLSCENCGELGWSVVGGIKEKFRVWMENAHARKKANDPDQDLTKKSQDLQWNGRTNACPEKTQWIWNAY